MAKKQQVTQIKGFKAMHLDIKTGKMFCQPGDRRHYYEVGKEYNIKNPDEVSTCVHGYHFCEKKINHVFNYYPYNGRFEPFVKGLTIVITEVIGSGVIKRQGDKVAVSTLKVLRVIPWDEFDKKHGKSEIKTMEFRVREWGDVPEASVISRGNGTDTLLSNPKLFVPVLGKKEQERIYIAKMKKIVHRNGQDHDTHYELLEVPKLIKTTLKQ